MNLDKDVSKKGLEHKIKIGDILRISKEDGIVAAAIRYAGMPNKNVFSVTHMYAVREVNLFFPKDTKKIEMFGETFEVKSVKPKELILEYL